MKCRNCGFVLEATLVNLGSSPPSNSYLTAKQLFEAEIHYPLIVKVCQNCWLAQTEDFADRGEFFSKDYAYFSSFSPTWLAHSKAYVGRSADRFKLNENSFVVEVASNDGYLLQYVRDLQIPCLGIEPTLSTANASIAKGIPTVSEFFGRELATKILKIHGPADLMVANNVLAHVPDIHDFIGGFKVLLRADGVASFEFPYLLNLINQVQFDTIYHEHYSYFSFTSVQNIFKKNGFMIFDIEKISTHGGSLRVYVKRSIDRKHLIQPIVYQLEEQEISAGVNTIGFYDNFQEKIIRVKLNFLKFLINANENDKVVVGYAAAAKGNTLLNFSGVSSDLISYVVDRNPHKQSKYLPGSHIPIVSEEMLAMTKPDYIVIFSWNLKDEICDQLSYTKSWGAKLVFPMPSFEVIDP